MKKIRLRNVISIITMAIMLLSTLGIGVYANPSGETSEVQESSVSASNEEILAMETNTCTVTFMLQKTDQSGFDTFAEVEIASSANVPEDPATIVDGNVDYVFDMWYGSYDEVSGAFQDPVDFDNLQGETLTVYGKYNEVLMAIIHYEKGDDVYSATVPEDQRVAVGELVKIGKATSAGNIFKNWKKDGEEQFYEAGVEIEMPAEGLTLVAQWKIGPDYLAKAVTGVSTLSGHQRIKVKWNKTSDTYYTIEKYVVYRYAPSGSAKDAGKWKAYATINVNKDGTIASKTGSAFDTSYKSVKNANKGVATAGVTKKDGKISGYYFEDKDVGDGLVNYNGNMRGGTFKYKVIPRSTKILSDGTKKTISPKPGPTVKSDQCVRTSFVKLKFKTNKKLTSHDKNKISKTFKSGSTVTTCGFGIGKYVFIYNDHMFYLNRLNAKGQKNMTNRNNNYSKAEAEYFVNARGNGSKTKYLIWVNTYCQKLYLFTGSKGKWKCKYVWKVSTGQAKTPTIRYIDPKNSNLDSGRIVAKSKSIEKKLRTRHGIPWWNCFSSYNGIHGKRSSWKIDSIPRSGGCIRNTNDHAKWIYNNCKKGTCVLVF